MYRARGDIEGASQSSGGSKAVVAASRPTICSLCGQRAIAGVVEEEDWRRPDVGCFFFFFFFGFSLLENVFLNFHNSKGIAAAQYVYKNDMIIIIIIIK